MPDYTIYSGTSGTYLATLTMPDLAQAQLNAEPGDVLVEGDFGPDSWWTGAMVQNLPPKPLDWLVWDGTDWVDPRDPAQIEIDLYQARYHTNTDQRLVIARLGSLEPQPAFPIEELVDDSTHFPARLEAYLNTLPQAERDQVKFALKYEPNIWRLHPYLIGDAGAGIQGFIPWLALVHGVTITPEQLDGVFGVPVPPPLYVPA